MFVLRDSESMREALLPDPPCGPEICLLIASRVQALSEYEGYTLEELVFFIVLEPGDTAAMLETELGVPVWDDGPSWEFLDEHPSCYEMVIVLSDNGFGAEIFIPKAPGIDPDIQALCQQYATPAQEHTDQ